MRSKPPVLSALFLVAGTCIGGGMLALPVSTGLSGFLPSACVMLLCWAAMTLSALLLLEVSLHAPKEAHMLSMSASLLGQCGSAITWALFLFISYASMIAYTAAGGGLAAVFARAILGVDWSDEMGCLFFTLLFGGMLTLSNRHIGSLNGWLFLGMLAAYAALVAMGAKEVQAERLRHADWSYAFPAAPLLLTTFSFQTMLPSLTPYLHRQARAIRWAIIGGTTLTLFTYLLWQSLVLGIVPVMGVHSLAEALERGEPITQFLKEHVASPWLSWVAEWFGFFALVTSFLGIGIGLKDFLRDGMCSLFGEPAAVSFRGKSLLFCLILIPTFLFAAYFERIFLIALESSGGIGDTILNGLFPICMVWIGRYRLGWKGEKQVGGGKGSLVALFLFFFAILFIQLGMGRLGMG